MTASSLGQVTNNIDFYTPAAEHGGQAKIALDAVLLIVLHGDWGLITSTAVWLFPGRDPRPDDHAAVQSL